MDKKEEFKEFIKSKPELIDYVKNKEYTWQDFYEIYDLYGKDEQAWNKYKKVQKIDERKSTSLEELTSLVKNINIDNVQKYINNAQKAINVITELTSKSKVDNVANIVQKSPRVINKFFGD